MGYPAVRIVVGVFVPLLPFHGIGIRVHILQVSGEISALALADICQGRIQGHMARIGFGRSRHKDCRISQGDPQNGTVEDIYAYMLDTAADSVSFVVGKVAVKKDVPCSTDLDENSKCQPGAPDDTCPVAGCNGDGVVETVYAFERDDTIVSLVDALNAWTVANSDAGVSYATWVVSGSTIINCTHNSTRYVAYSGEEETCVNVGHGDEICATCGKLIKENAEIPANPDKHTSPDGVIYTCVSFECVHCKTVIEATEKHNIDANKPCLEQTCKRCKQLIPTDLEHVAPDGFDFSKPCREYECTVCRETVHNGEHQYDPPRSACHTVTCNVCDAEIIKGDGNHMPGLAPNCVRNQTCSACGYIIRKAYGHDWGAEATCGEPQRCDTCGVANPDAGATGNHTRDREKPTCTDHVYCLVCNNLVEAATGHTSDPNAIVDCGHGRSCTECRIVLESATSKHTVDFSTGTVVRAATPERTGIVVAKCSVCQREVEAYTTYTAPEKNGYASVSTGTATLYVDSYATLAFGKVADYAQVVIADGYLPLQVVTVGVCDGSGQALSLNGAMSVKVVLNKSAAKMALAFLKVYHVKDGVATELAISAVADGYITFTAGELGTFLLAGEKTAAFAAIGTVPAQAQQTAALVGTYAFERKEDEV